MKKSTDATATLSAAVAVIDTTPATVAPDAGEVSVTVGGVVSPVPEPLILPVASQVTRPSNALNDIPTSEPGPMPTALADTVSFVQTPAGGRSPARKRDGAPLTP